MKICLDARLVGGETGGIESVVLGMAAGLSRLDDSDDTYLFLVNRGQADWLMPYVHGPCRPLWTAVPALPSRPLRRMRTAAGKAVPPLAAVWRHRPRLDLPWLRPGPPPSDGVVERSGAQLMHFTFQLGFRTGLPSIYQPHDLQHVHLPSMFSPTERALREKWYGSLCRQASMVAVTSTWVQRDVMAHFGLSEQIVKVVPLAPIVGEYEQLPAADLKLLASRLGLPPAFIFYPAQTWPHKNHLGLLKALALLRDRDGLVVPLVSSGRLGEYFPVIRRSVDELGLEGQVTWLGFVPTGDLAGLYRLARAVVIPTRFEAASGPLWDAFLAGTPAACSMVTSLPAQAGDAALLFDQERPEEIAEAIRRLWTNDGLRAELIQRGRANVARFTWDRTVRLFRAHYRRLLNQLTDADRDVLSQPPLL
jgi:glycosyltransferase involved in cell wall biosynthesis